MRLPRTTSILAFALLAAATPIAGCGDDGTTQQPNTPQDAAPVPDGSLPDASQVDPPDASQPVDPPDASPPTPLDYDASPNPNGGPTAAACDEDSDCQGGVCLGRPGGLQDGNPRFAGGYCTTIGCQAESQDGCGPDEWCLDGGGWTYCVELCSKAAGLECDRTDHVCLGLGAWGGCFSEQAVECNYVEKTGCDADEVCVRIGYEDKTLGRCEQICDPMNDGCGGGDACYYIRTYNQAFCGDPGTTDPEAVCTCDKCCDPGYACTPDLDGSGKHCKAYCLVSEGCAGGQCVPLENGSPWGGCVTPGSAGTP